MSTNHSNQEMLKPLLWALNMAPNSFSLFFYISFQFLHFLYTNSIYPFMAIVLKLRLTIYLHFQKGKFVISHKWFNFITLFLKWTRDWTFVWSCNYGSILSFKWLLEIREKLLKNIQATCSVVWSNGPKNSPHPIWIVFSKKDKDLGASNEIGMIY